MPPSRAIDRFKECFPFWANDIVKWTPNKDGSLKVELTGKRFYIFTYEDDRTIRLESVRMYQKSGS